MSPEWDNQYSGTAYAFSKVCGALPYAVAGTVSPDQRTVTMRGKAPVANSSCRVVGYRDDVLVFNLSPEAQPNANQSYAEQNTPQQTPQRAPSPQAYDIEYERFLQQWGSCFDPTQVIAANIAACDSALSFPRVSTADRTQLLERRSTLANVLNATTSPQRDNNRQSVIPTNWSSLVSFGAIVILFTIFAVPVTWPWLRDLHHRSVAKQNSTGEAPSAVPTSNPPSKSENVIQLPAMANNPPASYIPNEPPSESMSLKLKRSQRFGVMGNVIFGLNARIGLNAEEHSLVKKYRLGGFVVYDSKAREKYQKATNEHLEMTREHVPLSAGATAQFLGLGKTLFRLGRASVSAAMTALSLRITVDSLIQGVQVECKNMDELLASEKAIREAASNLKGYLETAVTFDGREEVIEL